MGRKPRRTAGSARFLPAINRIGQPDRCDIEIFLPDHRLPGFVSAATADMAVWMPSANFRGDGYHYLKVSFKGKREIGFIAAPPVTDRELLKGTIAGRELLLVAVPTIIAGKVHFLGNHLKARDIFDIAAACESGHREAISERSAAMSKQSAVALARVDELLVEAGFGTDALEGNSPRV